MKLLRNLKTSTLLGLLALVLGLSGAAVTHANPLQFVPTTQLATATTSVTYLVTGGSATSTSFDAFANGQPIAIDRGVLLTQFAASSTSSVLGIRFQYSIDNVDWYDDQGVQPTTATSSQPYQIATPFSYAWLAAGTATSSKMVNVNFPTRYVRAVYTEAGAGGAIWWQFVPQRQGK